MPLATRTAFRLLFLLLASAFPVLAEDAALPDAPVFDIGIEFTGASDYMDSGLTNSDHNPSGGVTITPSYGIFYATLYGATIDYGASDPWLETKFAVGATPTFGPYSIDFNLARRIKFDDPSADRWLPYVTGTFTPNDMVALGLGVGYYAYDDPASTDFFEFYGSATVTLANTSYLTGELYWEPDQDGAGNDYYAAYGTIGIPFLEKFKAVGTLGYEAYEDNVSTPSYLWSQISVEYAVTDTLSVLVGYHTNDLSGSECPLQAYTDCKSAVFAKVTYNIKLSDLFPRKTD